MKFEISQKPSAKAVHDILILGAFEGSSELSGAQILLDEPATAAMLAQAKREVFEGKLGQMSEYTPGHAKNVHKVLLIGLGKNDEFNLDKLRSAISGAVKRASALSAKNIAIASFGTDKLDAQQAAEAVASVAILATYKYIEHKSEEAKPCSIESVTLIPSDTAKAKAAAKGIKRGEAIANAVCYARDLVNKPANIVTPAWLADAAAAMAEESSLKCRILKPAQMAKAGMHLTLAVGKGSSEEARFITIEYKVPGAKKTIAIVGKGLTYDAGGLCLKQSRWMNNMKSDMAGAAAVLGAIRAAAELKAKVNILCVIPATENMPGGQAMKPGDIVKGFSGKSVEINDTDAEGRLILADAVAYAEKEKADEIIDIATLTGACEVALGKKIAGLMATSREMADRIIAAGESGGEKLWQLPLEPSYEETLKSDIADMKNCASEAGAITAAQFIKKHINDTPWAHIDIAGPSWADAGSLMTAKGGTGFGVYTLVNYLCEKS